MRQALAILVGCFVLVVPLRGEESPFPDGTAPRQYGGLMILRQGNQTTLTLGGVLFPRRVRVTTATPEGPVVTRFVLPSTLRSPHSVPLPRSAPALLQVEIPDDYGLLYIEGDLVRTRGTVRQLQSPDLPPGVAYPLHLRGAFKVGDNLLIQDMQIQIRAGESTTATFDGTGAVTVRLP